MDKHQKRICICHAQVPFMNGGAEVLVQSLEEQLKQRGYLVDVTTIPFKWYPGYEAVNGAMAWRMIDLEETDGQKIDLVIATKYPAYAVKHSNKVTWLLHQHRPAYDLYDMVDFGGFKGFHDGQESRKMIINIDNQTLPESKKIFSISRNVSERLKKFNNIDSTCLYPPPKFADRFYSESYGDYILSVGRIDPLKRLDLLISALPYCEKPIKVLIAGTGKVTEDLKKLSVKLNVSDRVTFLGFVSDEEVFKLYANAFSVFFAPKDEDYGYITIESFLSNKPIVTCHDSGGVLEFVENGVNGYISSLEAKEIAEKINMLYLDKKSCEKFGQNGHRIVKDITWDNAINRLTCTL